MTEIHTDAVHQEYRRKRVQRLKKIIIAAFITAILFPTVLCIFLFIKTVHLEKQVKELKELVASEDVSDKGEEQNIQSQQEVLMQESGLKQPVQIVEEMVSGDSAQTSEDVKYVYLTFDDGPSIYTGEILDILKRYDVKATFFVTGKEGKDYEKIFQRIVDEGHTLGMHSYSHKYDEIYASKENFVEDFTKLQEYLFDVTGVQSKIYRFPGGSSNTVSQVDMGELIDYLTEQGVTYYDWNISSGDSSGSTLSVEQIVDNCTKNIDYYNNAFVLLHDSKNKRTTVEALPLIIEHIIAQGNMQIVPITADTVPVQQIKN